MDGIQASTWSGFHEQIRYRVVQRDRTLARVHQRPYDIFKDLEGLPGAPGALHQIRRLQTFGHIPIPHYWPTADLSNQEFHFYKAQTIAAVKDVEVEEQINISRSRREELEEWVGD